MNAPSQTTPVGWFYADTKPSTHAAAWDGTMWPEVTGYRNSERPATLHAGFVDQLVQVQLTDDKMDSVKVAPQLSELTTPDSAIEVAGIEDRATNVTEGHAVAVALGEDGRASASGTVRLYVFLALLLAVAGMIIGVVL